MKNTLRRPRGAGIRTVACVLLFGSVFCLLFALAQRLLVPHDKAANPEAFLIHEYMQSDTQNDQVIFLGDCEVYEAVSPVTLWQEYGIESRVCGSPQQLMWHSYALLCEILERSTPDVVVLGVYGLCYGQPQSEAYNRMALDGLPMSATKWSVVRQTSTEGESALSYVFPLLRYHSRWSELTLRDLSLRQSEQTVSSRGYLVKTQTVPADSPVPSHEGALVPTNTDFGQMALDYFDRIVALCQQKGVQLVLFKAPTDSWRYPWLEAYEEQVERLARSYDLPYYNALESFEQIDLDLTTDSYDGGVHLNVSGAEKLTRWLGERLRELGLLEDNRQDASAVARWQADIALYEKMKQTEVVS